MNSQVIFIVKVLIISLGISLLIRYGFENLAIAPTNTNALIAITLPPLIVGLGLGWRFRKNRKDANPRGN